MYQFLLASARLLFDADLYKVAPQNAPKYLPLNAHTFVQRTLSTSEKQNVDNTSETANNGPTDALVEENKKLLDSLKDLDDKYKRALAEAENTRIRMRKQVDDTKVYAIQGFCKDLLDVADVFTTAIESVPKDSLKDNVHFKSLYDGVVMTEQQLQSVFRRHGVVQINPIGQKFDPNEHHAMFEVEVPDKEPGTVSVVTKIGYKLKERTIRPAMVGVVRASK